MAINLTKGETVNLSKETNGSKKFQLRAGWDVSYGTDMDIDIMSGTVSTEGKGVEFVYFGHMKETNGAIKLSGDNRTGKGDGWDETIYIDASKLKDNIKTIPAIISIYNAESRGQNFGLVRNLAVQIYDEDSQTAVADFVPELEFGTATALLLGEFVVNNGSLYFKPIARPYDNVRTILNEYKFD